MSDRRNQVEAILARLKSRRAVALVIVFGLVVTALSSFTDAVRTLFEVAGEFLSDDGARIEASIRSQAVELRWEGTTASWNHPRRPVAYENEMRLRLSLRNSGAAPANVEALRVLTESDGRAITWQGLYEAGDANYLPNIEIEPQIRARRSALLPFALAETDATVIKTIDFVPIDFPLPLAPGSFENLVQLKPGASDGWRDVLRFEFTIPAGFELVEGRSAGTPTRTRYFHWQSFPISGQGARGD